MAGTPRWPSYGVGPPDSIFALGVASTKFAELEGVLHFIFGAVFSLDMNASKVLPAKIGNEATIDLARRRLPETGWNDTTKEHVLHFLSAFGVCLANRNYLMHSELAWGGRESPVLFRTSKQGKTLGANPTLAELRAVADDINTYAAYGRALGNAINAHSAGPSSPVPASLFPWPDKPPLPRELRYSPDPQPLR